MRKQQEIEIHKKENLKKMGKLLSFDRILFFFLVIDHLQMACKQARSLRKKERSNTTFRFHFQCCNAFGLSLCAASLSREETNGGT